MSYSTILCAVDINGGKEDDRVLQYAKRMADLDEAQLDVITVVPDFGAMVVATYFQDHDIQTAKDGALEQLRAMAERALGAEANAKARHIVAVGSVYEEVLRAADLDGADLIVIGAHRPDLKDYLLGPNASRVVRHSNCSVLVVR